MRVEGRYASFNVVACLTNRLNGGRSLKYIREEILLVRVFKLLLELVKEFVQEFLSIPLKSGVGRLTENVLEGVDESCWVIRISFTKF